METVTLIQLDINRYQLLQLIGLLMLVKLSVIIHTCLLNLKYS